MHSESFQSVIMRALLVLFASLTTAASLPVSGNDNNNEFFNPYHDILTFKPDEYHERALRATSSDIIYYFFSKNNTDNSFQVLITSVATLAESAFDTQKDTVFVVHGWRNSGDSEINTKIRESILERHDINLFIVDWSIFADTNYITAQASVKQVGEYIAEFVTLLQHQYGLNLNKVKFVGHSLGAHVSGNAGRALNGQLQEITGLDPAGPLFTVANRGNRLDPTTAQYVQVIHSNAGLLGIPIDLGHSDFYPNGGQWQPGCGLDITGICSHGRSFEYYAESLNSDRFVSRQCNSYEDYENGECSSTPSSAMGRFEVDTSKTYMVSDEDEQYSCNRCNFNTRSSTELDKHMTSMHEKATNDFMSNYMSYLNQHACDLCEYKTYSKRVLGDHMLALHPEKIIKKHLCYRCEFITDSERELTEHIVSVHLDKKTYACDFCDYKSIWKNRIKKHEKAIHDKYLKRINKTVVAKTVVAKTVVAKTVVAKNLACDFCDYKTNINWQLTRHISLKHDNGRVKMHTTLTYVCDLCDYKTHTKTPLTRHLKSHQVMASLNETGKN